MPPFWLLMPASLNGEAAPVAPAAATLAPGEGNLTPGLTVDEAERRLIVMTLEHTRDNKTKAAELLGISLKTLHNKLNKLGLRHEKPEQP